MTCYRTSEVKPDWLDVTYSPEDFPGWDVGLFMQSLGAEASRGSDDRKTLWRVAGGTLVVQSSARWCRVSASGAVVDFLLQRGQWLAFLSLLAESTHRVTRLDACIDQRRDGADAVAELRGLYPRSCRLSRKAQGVKSILSPRADGVETGTFYVGHRKTGKATARVYDKAHEMLEVHGVSIEPTTRYEVTVRGALGPTLRDAGEPARMFWHFASPALLFKPEGVPDWEPGWGTGWEFRAPDLAPAEVLTRRVEYSADVGALIELADAAGAHGRDMLLRLLERRVRAA